MSIDKYRALMRELHDVCDSPYRDDVYSNACIEVEDVRFTLSYVGDEQNASIALLTDFGLPDPLKKHDIIDTLLLVNTALVGRAARDRFCINPASGHVLGASLLPLKHANACGLHELLQDYAAQARSWRQTFGLHA